jgi:ubiquinone biosynthesis protein
MPGLLHEIARRTAHGELSMEWRSRELEQLRREVGRNQRRLFFAVVGSALLIGAAVIAALDGYAPTMIRGVPFAAWLLGIPGVLILLAAWPGGD